MARRAPVWLLAAALGGCTAKNTVVDVTVYGGESAFTLDLDGARRGLGERVGQWPDFRLGTSEADPPHWQLTAEVRLATERTADEDPSQRRRALGLSGELRRLTKEGEGPRQLSAEALVSEVVKPGSSAHPLMERALDELSERLAAALRLVNGNDADFEAALASEDAHLRATAIDLIARSRRVGLRPALEKRMLADEASPREVMRIVGVLGRMKDPAAAPAIIDAISRHPELNVPLVFALGELGGPTAEAYLLTVKAGHDRPEVRAAAAEALGLPK